ncbi:MAG TPA: HD domain-containing protein [Phycisphaerae bacterium]|nr:HD domain-containing protein [Phycisphaerae bacterium]
MPISQCPGQDKRFWKPEDIFENPCPRCGRPIEFWKDDPRRRCTHCGAVAANPRFDTGCAKWCRFARECLGSAAIEAADAALGETLIEEMKQVFGEDAPRVRHALRVLDCAEQILQSEPADPLVVKAAAVLHDIGIRAAEAKHGSSAGKYQEIEGPPIARAILARHGVDAERIEHIERIVGGHHSAGGTASPEFRILWDADHLVNLFDEAPPEQPAPPAEHVDRIFRTETGRRIARRRLAQRGEG